MSLPTAILLALSLPLMAFAPLLLVALLSATGRPAETPSPIRLGNPLMDHDDRRDEEPPLMLPLVHVIRTTEEPGLRELMLGLRHLPIEQSEVILRRHTTSDDPELQLYAQSVLQEGIADLQTAFLKLRPLAGPDSQANTASYLGAGLRLLDAPFTPESEHDAIINALQTHATRTLEPGNVHPRLDFEAGRFFLRVRQPDNAQLLFHRLPQESPLWETSQRLLRHHCAIANPPPAHTTYTVT